MSRCGATTAEVAGFLSSTVAHDLSALLETRVKVVAETPREAGRHTVTSPGCACEPPVEWEYWGVGELSSAPHASYKEAVDLLRDN